jgi:hypothetical protein
VLGRKSRLTGRLHFPVALTYNVLPTECKRSIGILGHNGTARNSLLWEEAPRNPYLVAEQAFDSTGDFAAIGRLRRQQAASNRALLQQFLHDRDLRPRPRASVDGTPLTVTVMNAPVPWPLFAACAQSGKAGTDKRARRPRSRCGSCA